MNIFAFLKVTLDNCGEIEFKTLITLELTELSIKN